jgi:molecular chaperone DnaK (HSP70)
MILKYVKMEAEKHAKTTIKDVIIVVPNFWTIHQRNFFIEASKIAEMYVLSLIT